MLNKSYVSLLKFYIDHTEYFIHKEIAYKYNYYMTYQYCKNDLKKKKQIQLILNILYKK